MYFAICFMSGNYSVKITAAPLAIPNSYYVGSNNVMALIRRHMQSVADICSHCGGDEIRRQLSRDNLINRQKELDCSSSEECSWDGSARRKLTCLCRLFIEVQEKKEMKNAGSVKMR